jgi:hypothetical protein
MLYYFIGNRENAMTLWYQLPLGDFHVSRCRDTNPPALQKVVPAYMYHPPIHPYRTPQSSALPGKGPPPPPLEREAHHVRMEKARQPRSVRYGLAFCLSFVEGCGGLFFSGFSVRGLGEMKEADGP